MNATNASNALKAPNEVSAGFSIARFLRSILREYLVVVAIVWLVLITVVVEPNFMTPANMLNIMRQFGPLVMVALFGGFAVLVVFLIVRAQRLARERREGFAALAHARGDKVVQAYQRPDLLEQRRPTMQQWADATLPPPKPLFANNNPKL